MGLLQNYKKMGKLTLAMFLWTLMKMKMRMRIEEEKNCLVCMETRSL